MSGEERARRLLEEAFRLVEQGRLQPAIRACQQAIALNPTSTSAHSLLATLYERTGDRDGAIRELEQVLSLDPGSTAERRRLNELMGVPVAAAPTPVSARTARLAVTGAFIGVALVLLVGIVLTTRPGEPPSRQGVVRSPARAAAQDSQVVAAAAVAPSRLRRLGRATTPIRPAQRRAAERPAPAPRAAAEGFGQWLAPGTYLIPAGGRERFAGLQSAAPLPGVRRPSGLQQGAVALRPGRRPTVRTPGTGNGRGRSLFAGDAYNPRVARSYYFAGDYAGAIESYRGYLAQHPASAAPREELAWIYVETGNYQTAKQEYEVALEQNVRDIERGHNVEAAKHGARTCESAIKALETE
jgi:tetratricopeptide (TPR) repeat protein